MSDSPRNRLAILASGKGSNADAIMRYFNGHPDIEVVSVLSNREEAGVRERARDHGVSTRVFGKEQLLNGTVTQWLKDDNITHIVLAGFLWLIPGELLRAFPDRIVNIHPALLPKFGGKGMYGDRVHEAVLQAGEKQTGISIHLLNERFDEGRILFQKVCEVVPADTVASLAQKVNALEHQHYPRVIEQWVKQGS